MLFPDKGCFSRKYSLFLCVFALAVVLSCGGGGGDDSDNGSGAPGAVEQSPSLSVDTAYPGQTISVTHPSIKADDIVTVDFQVESSSAATLARAVNDGMKIPVRGIAHADGVVIVAVPPILDDDGSSVAHSVNVVVNGTASETMLQVEQFLQLDFPTQGNILMAFIDSTLDSYNTAWNNLDQIEIELDNAVDMSEVKDAIGKKIQTLEGQLFEITNTGTLTVDVNGSPVVLSLSDLDKVDLWLLHSYVSLDVAFPSSQSEALLARSQHIDPLGDMRSSFAKARDDFNSRGGPESVRKSIFEGIPGVLSKGQEAAETGISGLAAYLSIVTGGAGFLGDDALQTASKARNLANSQSSFFSSTLTAWLSGKNTDAFLNGDQKGFDAGNEIASQLARLGAEYGSSANNSASDWASIGFTIKDAYTAALPYCETLGICGAESSEDFYQVLAYVNFNGVTKDARIGDSFDLKEADISLFGNPHFPDIKWRGGDAIAVLVYDTVFNTLFGAVAREEPETNDLIPFSPAIHYGDYITSKYTRASGFPERSNSLLKDNIYIISVQRASDFGGAEIVFKITRDK